jgi:ABC-type lipoprotein release transport system permease subunit
LLLRIALRNIWLHRLRTFIVGGILAFGTTLLIVGNGLLDAVEEGMQKSIVRSIAGHVQVYSADAEDELALFGRPGMVEANMGKIDNFREVKDALLTIDNVKSVIPMGLNNAIVFGGNAVDLKCTELRKKLIAGEAVLPKDQAHLRRMIDVLAGDLERIRKLADLTEDDLRDVGILEKAQTDAYWVDFGDKAEEKLEEIANHIAPLGARADMFFIMYIGTDPTAFAEAFELFDVVEGQNIPEGQRGFLFNKTWYDRRMKNRVAFNLDRVKMLRDDEGLRISGESDLREKLAQNQRQTSSILMDLDPEEAQSVLGALQKEMDSSEADLETLLASFLDMDDSNFDRRVTFFYEHIGPRILLYRYRVGDMIEITGGSRARGARSVKLKVWGIFQFKSLEKSQLAGNHQMMDMLSFRELYGYLTDQEAAEMDDIINEREVDRGKEADIDKANVDDREADLFGGDDSIIETATSEALNALEERDLSIARKEKLEELAKPFTRDELESGVVMNMAVFLKDPSRIEATREAIARVGDERNLNIQTASWHEASGIIGNFTSTIRLTLNVAILIIFVVALVIMNNALVMATMERVREVGTIRAIGAQRSFVMGMFLSESLMMTIIFGSLGSLIGVGIMTWLEAVGIPAFHKILFFLFGGPSLHPSVSVDHVLMAVGICAVVSLVSTLYPAWLATRIQPVTAMQTND